MEDVKKLKDFHEGAKYSSALSPQEGRFNGGVNNRGKMMKMVKDDEE